jgi:phosphatidylserine/phosphatidylglycerophosphate/cardiolipin synthase-like enzyme
MRELAELVLFLKDAYRPEDLVEFVDRIRVQGADALGGSGRSDLQLIAERKLQHAGVLVPGGSPDAARASWLVVVADILTAVPPVRASSAKEQPLAFTVPTEAADLVRPSHRIDLLIGEAIRDATRHLAISSPYWNTEGLEALRPAIEAAQTVRHVACDFFTHSPTGHGQVLVEFTNSLPRGDLTRAWEYNGAEGSLMHAKFVVSDGERGYFGSANLTSLGLGEHFEVGVGLTPKQAHQLLELLNSLRESGLFAPLRQD